MARHSIRRVYNDTGDSTGTVFNFNRKFDESGFMQIEWVPDASGSNVTVELQVQLVPGTTWFPIITVTQAEMGSGASGADLQAVTMYPQMRIVVSDTTNAADDVKVWIQQ